MNIEAVSRDLCDEPQQEQRPLALDSKRYQVLVYIFEYGGEAILKRLPTARDAVYNNGTSHVDASDTPACAPNRARVHR